MNKVNLIGNVATDLELKNYTNLNGEGCFVKFVLAVSDYRKDETYFIKIVSFNKQAEILFKYVKLGNKLAIEGKLTNRSYISDNNEKKYITEVIIDDFQFLDNKKETAM